MISNLILTRLLFPQIFGLVAAAAAPIAGLVLISDFGVHAVIIQSPRGDEEHFLRSAWVFQLSRGVMLWALLVLLCILISFPSVHDLFSVHSVYAEKSFPLVTALMGVSLITGGAESTAVFLNLRRLNQKPIFLLGILTRALQVPITVAWAWIEPSVWALVGGGVVVSFVRLILTHIMIPGPRMSFEWEEKDIKEIVHFGKWIIVSSVASFVVQQSDILFFGAVFSSSALGIYAIAKLLINAVEGLLERINAALALPILGEVLRQQPQNLVDRYYRFRLPIDFAAAFLSGFLVITGPLFVGILYDVRYAEAGPMLQILAIGVCTYPFQLIRSAFTAIGEPHLVASVTIVQAVSIVSCMIIGFELFGLTGAIVGIAGHRLIPSAVMLTLAQKRNWIKGWSELRVFPMFILGLIAGKAGLIVAEALGLSQIAHLWH